MVFSSLAQLKRVCDSMERLGNNYGQSTIFVAQHYKADEKHASVVIKLAGHEEGDTDYLKLRRLFRALEYRFNEGNQDYVLKVELKKKKDK